MRVFVAISERGSLSAAARARGEPVANVSRKLAALESHLGARLVSRSTRRLALSEAGRRYLDSCRRVLAQVEEADRGATGDAREPHGTLRVTAPVAFGRLHVLPVIAEYLRANPRVDVALTLADRNLEWIGDGLDVAIRIGALPDSSLRAARVGAVRRITCASPGYLRERGRPARPEELREHDCVSFDALVSSERWTFPAPRGSRAVAVRSRLSVGSAEA